MFILRFCYKVLRVPYITRAVISQQVREPRGPGSWGLLSLTVNVFVVDLTPAAGPALLPGSVESQTERVCLPYCQLGLTPAQLPQDPET